MRTNPCNHVAGMLAVLLSALLPALLSARFASADEVELVNGDRVSGSVLSLTDAELRIQSELLGEIAVPRKSVAAIYLGDHRPTVRAAAPTNAPAASGPAAANGPAQTPEELFSKLTGHAVPQAGCTSPEDVLKQLKSRELTPQAIGDVQKAFPLLAAPEAQGYFNSMLSGLMTGEKDIGDLHKDAVQARDMLEDLKKDLGPEGAALNGYLGILNRFIDETTPPPASKPKPPAAAAPSTTPPQFPPKAEKTP
jgi:hypothetical protein